MDTKTASSASKAPSKTASSASKAPSKKVTSSGNAQGVVCRIMSKSMDNEEHGFVPQKENYPKFDGVSGCRITTKNKLCGEYRYIYPMLDPDGKVRAVTERDFHCRICYKYRAHVNFKYVFPVLVEDGEADLTKDHLELLDGWDERTKDAFVPEEVERMIPLGIDRVWKSPNTGDMYIVSVRGDIFLARLKTIQGKETDDDIPKPKIRSLLDVNGLGDVVYDKKTERAMDRWKRQMEKISANKQCQNRVIYFGNNLDPSEWRDESILDFFAANYPEDTEDPPPEETQTRDEEDERMSPNKSLDGSLEDEDSGYGERRKASYVSCDSFTSDEFGKVAEEPACQTLPSKEEGDVEPVFVERDSEEALIPQDDNEACLRGEVRENNEALEGEEQALEGEEELDDEEEEESSCSSTDLSLASRRLAVSKDDVEACSPVQEETEVDRYEPEETTEFQSNSSNVETITPVDDLVTEKDKENEAQTEIPKEVDQTREESCLVENEGENTDKEDPLQKANVEELSVEVSQGDVAVSDEDVAASQEETTTGRSKIDVVPESESSIVGARNNEDAENECPIVETEENVRGEIEDLPNLDSSENNIYTSSPQNEQDSVENCDNDDDDSTKDAQLGEQDEVETMTESSVSGDIQEEILEECNPTTEGEAPSDNTEDLEEFTNAAVSETPSRNTENLPQQISKEERNEDEETSEEISKLHQPAAVDEEETPRETVVIVDSNLPDAEEPITPNTLAPKDYLSCEEDSTSSEDAFFDSENYFHFPSDKVTNETIADTDIVFSETTEAFSERDSNNSLPEESFELDSLEIARPNNKQIRSLPPSLSPTLAFLCSRIVSDNDNVDNDRVLENNNINGKFLDSVPTKGDSRYEDMPPEVRPPVELTL